MAIKREKKQKKEEGSPAWVTSFADMTNLMLCFFVLLYAYSEQSQKQNEAVIGLAFQGFGAQEGGKTLQVGQMLDMGHNIMSFPSSEKGTSLARAKKRATSIFQPEVHTNKVRITEDERGLIISLAANLFFEAGEADIDIEQSRDLLQKLAQMLNHPDLKPFKYRLEGHTDSTPTDPGGLYPTNWELSAARAINTLKYLVYFGVDEKKFQVSGLADTVPLVSNETEEGRAVNRRVDVVIITEGHL